MQFTSELSSGHQTRTSCCLYWVCPQHWNPARAGGLKLGSALRGTTTPHTHTGFCQSPGVRVHRNPALHLQPSSASYSLAKVRCWQLPRAAAGTMGREKGGRARSPLLSTPVRELPKLGAAAGGSFPAPQCLGRLPSSRCQQVALLPPQRQGKAGPPEHRAKGEVKTAGLVSSWGLFLAKLWATREL